MKIRLFSFRLNDFNPGGINSNVAESVCTFSHLYCEYYICLKLFPEKDLNVNTLVHRVKEYTYICCFMMRYEFYLNLFSFPLSHLQRTSRVGWQSPPENNTPMSPKSDHTTNNTYQHIMVKSVSPKFQKNCQPAKCPIPLANQSTTNTTHTNQQQHKVSMVSNERSPLTSYSKTMDSNLNHYDHQNKYYHQSPPDRSYSASHPKLSATQQRENFFDFPPKSTVTNRNEKMVLTNRFGGSQTSSPLPTTKHTTPKMAEKYQKSKDCINQNTKPNPLEGYDMSEIRFVNGQKGVRHAEPRYGKIMSTNTTSEPIAKSKPHYGPQDKIIADCPTVLMNEIYNNNNNVCVNNNHYHSPQHTSNISIHYHPPIVITERVGCPRMDSPVLVKSAHCGGGGEQAGKHMMRANRYSNGSLSASSAAGSHHHLSHMINSLSSPESAYSTGYSTDGTSPGGKFNTMNGYFDEI